MAKDKLMHKKADVSDALEQMQETDLNSASKVEYYANLAALRFFMGKICEEEEQKEFSQRGYAPGAYRTDGQEWGAWNDGMSYGMGSERRSPTTGRYMSYTGNNFAEPVERLREMLHDPTMAADAKEAIRKAIREMER